MNSIRMVNDADRTLYEPRKLKLFNSLFLMNKQNQTSDVKAIHLYALLYSKYYTQRAIAHALKEEEEVEEDDESIKEHFRNMLRKDIASKTHFESLYLTIVRELKNNPSVITYYESLNLRMVENKLTSKEKEEFVLAVSLFFKRLPIYKWMDYVWRGCPFWLHI
jgi:hypothetical protein